MRMMIAALLGTGPGRHRAPCAGKPSGPEAAGHGGGAGESQHRHGRAARVAAGHRTGHGAADRGYRQQNGGFKKLEDLMNVRGIGEAAFLKLRSLVTITAPRTDRAATQ